MRVKEGKRTPLPMGNTARTGAPLPPWAAASEGKKLLSEAIKTPNVAKIPPFPRSQRSLEPIRALGRGGRTQRGFWVKEMKIWCGKEPDIPHK